MEEKFIDYIIHRIVKSKHEGRTAFTDFLKENKEFVYAMQENGVTDGQEVLEKLLLKYRRDKNGRVQIGILVNAYRSFCKYRDREDISIRRITQIPFF